MCTAALECVQVLANVMVQVAFYMFYGSQDTIFLIHASQKVVSVNQTWLKAAMLRAIFVNLALVEEISLPCEIWSKT